MSNKIYHFNDLEEFFGEDDWKMQIDVTDIWNQYNEKKISLKDFNAKYHNRLLEYKKDISDMGDDVWVKLTELLEKMKVKKEENELISLYDDIYNWADQNDILIKTK
jgi:hypothetical protein